MAKRLDLKDVNIYYGAFHAVADVALSVPPRSVTAFIGPSGCGKSTVLRTLNRMHEVIPGARVEGSVLLDGEDIYGAGVDPVGVRKTIGMVFQRPNPVPHHVDSRQRGGRPEAAGRAQQEDARRDRRALAARAPTCGTRSRTGSTSPAAACPAVSSSGCASPAPSRCSPTCC